MKRQLDRPCLIGEVARARGGGGVSDEACGETHGCVIAGESRVWEHGVWVEWSRDDDGGGGRGGGGSGGGSGGGWEIGGVDTRERDWMDGDGRGGGVQRTAGGRLVED